LITMPEAVGLAEKSLQSESALEVRNLVRAHFQEPLLQTDSIRPTVPS